MIVVHYELIVVARFLIPIYRGCHRAFIGSRFIGVTMVGNGV